MNHPDMTEQYKSMAKIKPSGISSILCDPLKIKKISIYFQMRKPITMDRLLLKYFACYSTVAFWCDINIFSLYLGLGFTTESSGATTVFILFVT